MFRYIERAENTARLIDAGLRMSLTRMHGHEEEWESVLRSSGVFNSYLATKCRSDQRRCRQLSAA